MPADHLQRALLAFFDREQRDLPWRRNRHVYPIWISEVMLQQTQVTTVLPYYRAFLAAFPDVAALAAAPVEAVLARWSGLGYYRRARQLHAAAGQIVAAGGFPQDAAGWRELPGIGPYTAAAIASQAFGEVAPLLDGNVERVLCRRLALAEDPKRQAVRKLLLEAAAELLDPRRPGDSNQALMELGATVCRPRAPLCLLCPLAEGCRGKGSPELYPAAKPQRASEKIELAMAVVEQDGRHLFFRRPPDAPFLADMWELPNLPAGPPAGLAAELGRIYGGGFELGPEARRFRHGITYRRIEIAVYPARFSGAARRESCWANAEERRGLALSSMFEKALA
jgi:A/G-specific adenine glycosylase